MKLHLATLAFVICGTTLSQATDLYWEVFLDAQESEEIVAKQMFAHADGRVSYAETWEDWTHHKGGWSTRRQWTHFWIVDQDSTVLRHLELNSAETIEIAEDPDGNVFLGLDVVDDDDVGQTGSRELIKLTPGGQEIWRRDLPAQTHWADIQNHIAVDESGNSYVVYANTGGIFQPVFLRSYDPDGNIRFEVTVPGGVLDISGALRRDFDDSIIFYGADAAFVPSVFRFSETGQFLGSLEAMNITPDRSATGPNSTVYRGSGTTLTLFDWDGNVQWTQDFPANIVAVKSDADHVYVTTSNQAIFLSHQGAVQRASSLPGAPQWTGFDGLGTLGVRTGTELNKVGLNLGFYAIHDAGNPAPVFAFGKRSDWYDVSRGGFGGTRLRRFRGGVEHHAAQIVRGNESENSHQALFSSSDGYWGLKPGVTLSSQQAPISIILDHVAPSENPSEFGVIIESRGSATAVAQSVSIYNYLTGTWTNLETNVNLPAGGSPDRYVVLDVASPIDHIGPNREVQVRVEYRALGPVLAFPWTARIDREMLHYVKQ